MAKINIKTAKKVVPVIYCYTTPEIARHDGWCKIGYSEQESDARIDLGDAGTVQVQLQLNTCLRSLSFDLRDSCHVLCLLSRSRDSHSLQYLSPDRFPCLHRISIVFQTGLPACEKPSVFLLKPHRDRIRVGGQFLRLGK